MSNEYWVALLGLVIGYWLVSKMLSGNVASKHEQPQNERDDPPKQGGAAQNPDAPGELPWHTVLGVARTATLAEIRTAYKTQMSQYHPDKVASLGADLRALAERKSKEINTAYGQAIKLKS